MTKQNKRGMVEDDLRSQLNEKGLKQSYYHSLVDNYMMMWDMMNDLQKDVAERGVNIPWNNGGGQNGVKKNDSVDGIIRTSSAMLKILSELGLRGANIKEDEGYEDM